ncbi:MAG TPA: NAD(P)/FAD-dependent oxidoreductase [Methanomassiliicoccales archaeon]|nr:NAD(P)/FAD-dependent oxidoreductase [Methanomassiliicoccales archaeon]
MQRFDVLVVGAGPAGSAAGRAAAENGAKTLVIDRKKEIGTPVQCGEVIGRSVLEASGLQLPSSMVVARQEYTRFVVDRKFHIDNRSAYWKSMTVERKLFDKYLAAQAGEAGAKVHADSRLISIERDGDSILRAGLRSQGKDISVEAKVIVAADGVHSTVGKLMSRPDYIGDEVAKGVEYEMVSKRRLPPCMQIFVEPEIGLGYGWIIPKGPFRANVGLGLVGRSISRREVLMEWITEHPVVSRYFDGETILEVKTGDAPVPGFQGGPVQGNVLYAGDAAGQTLAFVGEGIMPSYICGTVAGRIAARAAIGGLEHLKEYDPEVRAIMGEEMELGSELRDALVFIWSLPDLDEHQKSVVSGMIMNELVSEDDMSFIGSAPAVKEMMAVVKQRIASSGRPIKMTKIAGR